MHFRVVDKRTGREADVMKARDEWWVKGYAVFAFALKPDGALVLLAPNSVWFDVPLDRFEVVMLDAEREQAPAPTFECSNCAFWDIRYRDKCKARCANDRARAKGCLDLTFPGFGCNCFSARKAPE